MPEPMSAALDVLLALVLEDGSRWGERATDVQRQDAAAVLDSIPANHWISRSRGYSKTTDAAGWCIAGMLAQLGPASRLYALAADRDQGRLVLDALEGFARRTPELAGALEVGSYRVTALRSGSVLEVVPADAASSWGLRPDFVVIDELTVWPQTREPRALFESVTTALVKRSGARLAIITTAGDPAHWSRKVFEHALSDPAWRVSVVEGPAPWISAERIEAERRRLPASSFDRLFGNRWIAAEDRLVRPEDLAACVNLDGPQAPQPGRSYRIGVDVGLRHDRTVIAVCHAEPVSGSSARRVVLDRMVVLAGTRAGEVSLAAVEEAVAEASAAFNGARVRLDPWQAIGLKQRLAARGVTVEEFTFSASSVGRLASTLHLLLRDRLLALPDDEALLDELGRVRLRETAPGVLRLDHDADGHDDRAVALALAASALLERGGGQVEVAIAAGRDLDDGGLAATMPRGATGMRLNPARYRPDGTWVPPLPSFWGPR